MKLPPYLIAAAFACLAAFPASGGEWVNITDSFTKALSKPGYVPCAGNAVDRGDGAAFRRGQRPRGFGAAGIKAGPSLGDGEALRRAPKPASKRIRPLLWQAARLGFLILRQQRHHRRRRRDVEGYLKPRISTTARSIGRTPRAACSPSATKAAAC
ncbi:MAG: hypothetical protein R3F11_22830 [Verrucomicrobiales bacterium]